MAASWERLDLGDLGEDVAAEMHRAAPVSGLRERLGDRADRAGGDARAPRDLADVLDAAR